MSRALGETAPLLFTAIGSQSFSTSLTKPIAALPLVVYIDGLQPYADLQRIAWGTALFLVTVAHYAQHRQSRHGETAPKEIEHEGGLTTSDGAATMGDRRERSNTDYGRRGAPALEAPGARQRVVPERGSCERRDHGDPCQPGHRALIDPPGSGKTTLLRAMNRLHDATRGAKVSGSIRHDGADLYGPGSDAVLVRTRIGMVFQRPNVFPTMSIHENVVSGLRFAGVRKKALLNEAAESALIAAALWDEVRHRLRKPATSLSGGQQQRLCIARALAVEPDVLLMDEPTSSLDPSATKRIEELLSELVDRVTIVIVTHNMQQAHRVSGLLRVPPRRG